MINESEQRDEYGKERRGPSDAESREHGAERHEGREQPQGGRGEEQQRATPPSRMSVEEAGRKGGESVKRERGREFYSEIGRKGGEARKAKLGPGGYKDLGRKGGEARREQLGERGYSDLGRRGGEIVKKKYGPDFYSEIGRKGGQTVAKDREHMAEIGRKGGASRGRRGDMVREEKSTEEKNE